jgi:capsid protein
VKGFLSRLAFWRRPSAPGAEPQPTSYRGVYTATGYHVVRVAVRDGALGTQGSGNFHEKLDRVRLLDLSREFYRDNPIYSGVINRAAAYTVGNGFGLQCRSSDEGWNRLAETWWRAYWKRPEIRQMLSGPGVERMFAKELFRSGEGSSVKTSFGTLQLIEAEQIAGPAMMDDGIRRGPYGEPLGYRVCPYFQSGGVDVSSGKEFSPLNFIYACDPDRPTSSRGVPPLQSTFSMLRRIDDIFNSEALARQIQSRLALSITKESGGVWGQQASTPDPTKTATDGDVAGRIMQWDGGLIFTGKPGEKVESISRGTPGPDFERELIPFIRTLGAPLGIPLEFIFMDWTKTNYSQSRAILEQAAVTFLGWQILMEQFFHTPVFEWALARAIERKDLPTPPVDDWDSHEWIKPAFPWIDQLKEAQAYGEQLDRGFTTHANVLKSRNIDRGDFLEQREREARSAIEIVQRIEKDTGVKLAPEIFMGMKAATAPPPPPSPAAQDDPQTDEPVQAPAGELPQNGRKA